MDIKAKINEIGKLAGIDDPNFYTQLVLNRCIISGSYILYILNGTEYDDIDIYHICSRTDNNIDNIFGDYLMKQGLAKNLIGCSSYSLGHDQAILNVTNYKKDNNKTIQFIQLKYGTDMIDYVDTFDISVCKNFYDVVADNLFITDHDCVDKKTFRFTYKSIKSPIRCAKYIKRGYTKIANEPTCQ